jgi:hypothetical protein
MEDDLLDLRREWIDGTGDWILSEGKFLEWNRPNDSRPRILSIHGPPGSGKSVLAAHLICTFMNIGQDYGKRDDPNICVYSFCRHDDERKRDIKTLLRTVIFDLTHCIKGYAEVVHHFFETGQFNVRDMNSMGFWWRKVLIRQLENSKFTGTIRWVIDGFDESDNSQRQEFLKYVSELQHVKICLKIIVVGRYDEVTHTKLRGMGCNSIEINTQTNFADIRTVIRHHVQSSELLSSPGIVAEVTSWLENHAFGLFLWVRLSLEEISRRDLFATDDRIMERLRSLPKTLGDTYDRILSTLKHNLSALDLQLSKEIFKWTINVHRPLSLEELGSCLAPEFGQLTNLSLEIKRCCGGLIVLDGAENVRLLHLTVSEYANHAPWFFTASQLAHSHLAMRTFNAIPRYDPKGLSHIVLDDKLLDPLRFYACRYWWYHVQASPVDDEELCTRLLSFFGGPRLLSWIDHLFNIGEHFWLPKAAKAVHDWVNSEGVLEPKSSQVHFDLESMTSMWLKDLVALMVQISCVVEEYDGEEKDGQPHGFGTCTYDNEIVYVGCWEEGRRYGFGVYRFPGGVQYEGETDRGFHGKGIYKFGDGVSYTGTWIERIAQPGGVWRFPDGSSREHVPRDDGLPDDTLPRLEYATFDGTCPISKHDAVGKFDYSTDPPTWIYPNGAQYKGDWKDGKESGYGEWRCVCGCEYRGQWLNGDHHGEGVWTHSLGLRRYSGGWVDGHRAGFGTLYFHTGDEFRGFIGERERFAEGELIFANGNVYRGTWHGLRLTGAAMIDFGKEWLARVGL